MDQHRFTSSLRLRHYAGALLTGSALMTGSLDAAQIGQQWPQWRGPLANGVAPNANPPTTWSETQNIKWKVKIPGSGTSTPIIWDNQVLLQTAIKTGKKVAPETKQAAANGLQVFGQVPANPNPASPPSGDGPRRRGPGGGFGGGEKPTEEYEFVILSLDRVDGKVQWQKAVRTEVPHEGHHRDHGFASRSPVIDGEHIYSFFGSRGLHCLTLRGDVVWQKDLGKQRTVAGFGEGSSPALHGDTLVVNWDHEGEDFIVAFDKKTGRERWRNIRDEKTTWSTPLILERDGRAQVIVTASQRTRSYDLETGKQLWECGGMTANVIPTPVSDFGFVYAISGFRGNALQAIKLGGTGDLTDTDAIAWKHGKSTPYVPSPLLYGERLYFIAGNNPILSAFNARSGQPLFDAERLEGPSGFYASPVGASQRVYLAGRNGTSLVIKDADKLEILATNKLDDKFDASPAIVGRELFLRGHEYLYCIAEP